MDLSRFRRFMGLLVKGAWIHWIIGSWDHKRVPIFMGSGKHVLKHSWNHWLNAGSHMSSYILSFSQSKDINASITK
jgi:hypothetical protein